MFVAAIACSACADDTNDITTSGPADAGATNTSSSKDSGAASGNADSSTSESNTNTNPDGSNTNVRLTDAEIASVSMTANMGEIQQNMIAVSRAKSDAARSFAQDMVDMHTAALNREKEMAMSMNVSPTDNAITQMLKATSDKMVATLQSASDDDFDSLYLRGQLDAHQMVLNLIDNTLLPSAQAQPLRDELTMMRGTVMMHLERVRALVGED